MILSLANSKLYHTIPITFSGTFHMAFDIGYPIWYFFKIIIDNKSIGNIKRHDRFSLG